MAGIDLRGPSSGSAASASFADRGNWTTATAYVVGDVVTQSGIRYIAKTAHTSGTFATDLAANDWTALASNRPVVTKYAAYTAADGDIVLTDASFRQVADGVTTNASPTVTSATAAFTSADVGKPISGTNIPASSYVGVVNSGTSVGLSSSATANTPVNATASGSGITLTIGGAFAVTLPAVTSGRRVTVKKTDSSTNAVTVSPASGTIDGASSSVISGQYQARDFVSDGTNWFVA